MNNFDGLAYLGETLLEMTLATSAAMILVMLLRRPVRAHFGASVAYSLWLLVPASLLAVLLPAREIVMTPAPTVYLDNADWLPSVAAPSVAVPADTIHWELPVWLLGVVAAALWFAWRQWRFQRGLGRLRVSDDDAQLMHAETVSGLPAVIGCWKPRIVLPADFELRYSVDQRRLMLAHERTHIRSGDLQFNALLLLLRCLFWFNPLVHFIARAFRHDQELACDQRVIAKHPGGRRSYGEAMIHTQLVAQALPLACQWGYSHPLKERIAMLKQPRFSATKRIFGFLLATVLVVCGGCLAWAGQPKRMHFSDAIPEGQVRLDLDVSVDGVKGRTVTVLSGSGERFAFNGHSDGRQWAIDGVATDQGDGTVHLDLEVYRDGFLATSPEMVVKDGDVGRIAIGDDKPAVNMLPFEMSLRATTSAYAVPSLQAVGKRDGQTAESSKLVRKVGDKDVSIAPLYPPEARRALIEGDVVLNVLVDADGSVLRAEVRESTPAGVFDQASIDAVMQWKMPSVIDEANPKPTWIQTPLRFTLHDGDTSGYVKNTEVNSLRKAPRPLTVTAPQYPETVAGKNGGRVMLRVTVLPDGSPSDLKVVESDPPGVFDATAIAAISTWEFEKPESGKPTQVLVPVKFAPEGQ